MREFVLLRTLSEKQDEIAENLAAIQAEQGQLAQEWENLQAEQTRLAHGWEDLQAEQAHLGQEWEDLQAERGRVDEEWARLRERGTSLAEQEQKLQGFLRWSVVAVVISGLLAVPSVLVLVALMRQDQRASGKGIERGRDSGPHRRGQVIQHGGLAAVAPASIHGNDGRGKEGVGYSV